MKRICVSYEFFMFIVLKRIVRNTKIEITLYSAQCTAHTWRCSVKFCFVWEWIPLNVWNGIIRWLRSQTIWTGNKRKSRYFVGRNWIVNCGRNHTNSLSLLFIQFLSLQHVRYIWNLNISFSATGCGPTCKIYGSTQFNMNPSRASKLWIGSFD